MIPSDLVIVYFRRLADGRTWSAERAGDASVAGVGDTKAAALRDLDTQIISRQVARTAAE